MGMKIMESNEHVSRTGGQEDIRLEYEMGLEDMSI